MASLVLAMATGEVPPDEAATIAGVFEIRRKTIKSLERSASPRLSFLSRPLKLA